MKTSVGIGISPVYIPDNNGEEPIVWLLRDKFTTDHAAGSVNGTAAEPGPGTRGVVDLDSRISIAGGKLVIAAGGSTGDRTAFWYTDVITRIPGYVVAWDFTTSTGGGNTLHMGLADNTGADSSYFDNVGIRSLAGLALFIVKSLVGTSPRIVLTGLSTTYRIYQVLRASGMFVFLKSAGVTKFLWADSVDSTASLYWGLWHFGILQTNYDNIEAISSPVYQVLTSSSDSFNRADGAPGNTDGAGHAEANSGSGLPWTDQLGTAAISSNTLVFSALDGGSGEGIVTVDTGNTDEFITVEATRAGDELGIVTRYVDANNYIRVYHDGTNLQMDKIVGGVVTNVANYAIAPVAGATIKAKCDGTDIWAWYDNTDCDMEPETIADAILQTGTKHGVYSTNVGNQFDNWYTIQIDADYSDLGAY